MFSKRSLAPRCVIWFHRSWSLRRWILWITTTYSLPELITHSEHVHRGLGRRKEHVLSTSQFRRLRWCHVERYTCLVLWGVWLRIRRGPDVAELEVNVHNLAKLLDISYDDDREDFSWQSPILWCCHSWRVRAVSAGCVRVWLGVFKAISPQVSLLEVSVVVGTMKKFFKWIEDLERDFGKLYSAVSIREWQLIMWIIPSTSHAQCSHTPVGFDAI
jgi:hypothetical protein